MEGKPEYRGRIFRSAVTLLLGMMLIFSGCLSEAGPDGRPSSSSPGGSDSSEKSDSGRPSPAESSGSSGQESSAAQPSGKTDLPALHVEDGHLADETGSPVQLRGMSTHGIRWYPQYANQGAFRFVKEAGGNVIRIAMYTDTENGYLAAPEENVHIVQRAVEDALAVGMYVIVDWHILSDGDPTVHQVEAAAFFETMASAYAGNPAILYEIANEPNGVSWDVIRSYAETVIPMIRKHSPDAVIIVGTPEYSFNIEEAVGHPLPMENLMYAYHYYAGEKDTYRGLALAAEKKCPVFVSEWGIGNDPTGETALEEGREFVAFMNGQGISWCAWSFCNKEEPYSLIRSDCLKTEGFTADDLTAVGRVYYEGMPGAR